MVAFNEMAGSPSLDPGPSGTTGERKGYIAWSDIEAFIAQVFPATIVAGSAVIQGAGVAFPGFSYLRASSMRIEPHGNRIIGPSADTDFDELPVYSQAMVTIKYTTPAAPQGGEFDPNLGELPDPVPFLTHEQSIGGELLTIPGQRLLWGLDLASVPEDINSAIFVPTTEHSITWPRVLSPPWDTIRACRGKVNLNALRYRTGVIQPECGLFLGAGVTAEVLSNGNLAWQLQYKMSERTVDAVDQDEPGGWNHFFRNDVTLPGWYRIIKIGTTDGIYPAIDMSGLFVSGGS